MSNKQQPIIVGLDIGTTKVVAIAGRKNEFGKIEILGFGRAESAGVSHGVVMNIEQCIRSIEQAIERCLASNPQLEIKDVYVGIAGQHMAHQSADIGAGMRARDRTANHACIADGAMNLTKQPHHGAATVTDHQIADTVAQPRKGVRGAAAK